MLKKICIECGKEKNICDFYKTNNYYRSKCKKCFNLSKNRKANKEKHRKSCIEYYYKNAERFSDYKKEHISDYRIYRKKYREKRRNDELFKLKNVIRNKLHRIFISKGTYKDKYIEDILCCSGVLLYKYLLQTFRNNYGYEWDEKEKINIDHIIPLAVAETKEEIIKLNHYTNLQLLKEKDNLKKGIKNHYEIKDNEII